MKNPALLILTFFCSLTLLSSCQPGEASFEGMTNNADSVAYARGQIVGENFAESGQELNTAAILQGIKDGFAGEGQLTEEDITAVMTKVQQAQEEANRVKMESAGQDFLETNKTAEGVLIHESGLQYIILSEGTGESPSITDQVVAHYKGMLIDGTVFDSSYDRGEPATFPLNRVVPAWQIALPMMKMGGKMKIFVPHALGYGAQGAGNIIPPYSTLIFEIELVDILKAG